LAHCATARNEEEYQEIFPLIAAHENLSCDIAAATAYGPQWLERLVAAVGARKVMYGTDWPYWSSGPESYLAGGRRWRMITDECKTLSAGQQQGILGGNALKFVRNELPHGAGTRAAALHARAVVVAIHDHNPIGPDLPLMRAGGVTAKLYQVGVDVEIGANYRQSAAKRDGFSARALAAINDARETISGCADQCVLALSAADIERAKQAGKIAVMLGVEGGKLLEGRPESLREFHALGLRELQLRWAVPNQLVERDALTEFGVHVVDQCQRLGVLVDLTHIPEQAFHQAVERLEVPFLVSHGTGRELGERRVQAIARARGAVGIHFYSSYLGAAPNVLDVLDAVRDLARMGGVDVVCLGIDLFPSQGAWQAFQRAQGTKEISWAIPSLARVPQITRGLVARGFTDEEILAILGGNFLRVCREAMSSS
jgi:membrane dipeptidase